MLIQLKKYLILHKHDEVLLKHDIVDWAIANNWEDRHADALGTLAQKIGDGKRVRILNKNRWQEGIIQILEAQL